MPVKNGMRPVHPGQILVSELVELDMSPSQFAKALAAPICRVKAILQCDEGITAEMALRLSRYLGTSAKFWMNLQVSYDLKTAERSVGHQILKDVQPRPDMPEVPTGRDDG